MSDCAANPSLSCATVGSKAFPIRLEKGLEPGSRRDVGDRSACKLGGDSKREWRGGGSDATNEAGPLRACRVTCAIDCRNPIRLNEKAVDELVGATSLAEAMHHATKMRDG